MGAGILSAASKTYITWNRETDENGQIRKTKSKTVHKGLSLKLNPHIDVEDFEGAILRQTVAGGQNRGFAMREGRLHFYQCDRNSITGFYPKRLHMSDNISTMPLRR